MSFETISKIWIVRLLVLVPLSFLYRIVVHVRNCMFIGGVLKIRKLPGYTISVGNIEVGGTGKTPIVVEVCKYLKSSGHFPAIVARGYKSGLSKSEFAVFENGLFVFGEADSENIHADEAILQSSQLPNVPVIIGADRYQSCLNYLSCHDQKITHFILDDGFQHRLG